MTITRNMFKKNQQDDKHMQQQTRQTLNELAMAKHKINFIDSSIEWRKNKVKKESCVFQYIYI